MLSARAPASSGLSARWFAGSGGGRPRGRATAVRVYATSSDAKQVVITGGNTGIGFETAKALSGKGMDVVIACRNTVKAGAAVAKLKAENPSAMVSSMPLDLADLASVRDFSSAYLDSGRKLDVLINNAGVMACPEMATKDGFELQLGVNHLGHFALTNQLLPLLEDPSSSTRIINVSSTAHSFGTINFDDLMGRKGYQPWVAYGQSKLANILFTYELARRLPKDANCTVNTLHPGVVDTELSRYLIADDPPFWQKPFTGLLKMFVKSPAEGAETSIYLASSGSVEGITAKYWDNCETKTSSAISYDREVAKKLWTVSQELVEV
mmetsp:Transcript_11294/g.28946  ORF Transcript_11294/g.28946 Transcript_11294/m.28946 type:complete len:324 (-) Transcript_11294:111-1082(-)